MNQRGTIELHQSFILTANQRLHWRRKADIVANLRLSASTRLASYFEPVGTRQHVTVNISFHDARRRDIANWHPTVKALMDGITDAGIWPDDNDAWVLGPDLRATKLRSPTGEVWFEFVLEDAC